MKKVMVHAYTQFNLGDDLFIKILCERYPETIFILPAPKQYKNNFKSMSNLRVFANDSFFIRGFNYLSRKLKSDHLVMRFLARNCDAVVLIGGSLFIQDIHWQKNLKRTKSLAVKGKPFFLLGTNFGPFNDRTFYFEHKKLFKRYTDICFRDEYSYNLFSDLRNVRLASDVIFQLEPSDSQHTEQSVAISIIKPSIRKHLANKDAIYYQKVKEIIIQCIENGHTVILMSFCELEQDHEALEIITNSVPTNYLHKLRKHYYKGNIQNTLDIIARSRFVIATRFHAMILGWLYGKPVFPIIYSEKMEHVINDIGFKGSYTDFDQLDELDPAQVFSDIKTNFMDITAQIKSSKKHFNKLDTYLLSDKKG